MLVREFLLSGIFVLAVISLISVLFTDKKRIFAGLALILMAIFYFMSESYDMVESLPLIAFIMGVTLIALEVFIPSFGVIGISGIILTAYGVINILRAGYEELVLMVVAALTILISVIVYVRLGFRVNIFDQGILKTTNSRARGFNSKADYSKLLGKTGLSKSILRPSGRIEIDGSYYDGISNGDFIKANRPIEVISIKDGNIIVKEK
ncbi:MAG: NfeD family protein [Anaerococcus sp.]|nr:NfeD family protein [Anaerococcus sp.]